MNITDEVEKKDLIKIVKVYEENELEPIVKKEKTNKKIYHCKSKKHRHTFKRQLLYNF